MDCDFDGYCSAPGAAGRRPSRGGEEEIVSSLVGFVSLVSSKITALLRRADGTQNRELRMKRDVMVDWNEIYMYRLWETNSTDARELGYCAKDGWVLFVVIAFLLLEGAVNNISRSYFCANKFICRVDYRSCGPRVYSCSYLKGCFVFRFVRGDERERWERGGGRKVVFLFRFFFQWEVVKKAMRKWFSLVHMVLFIFCVFHCKCFMYLIAVYPAI